MSHAKALSPLEVPPHGPVPRLSDERCRFILASASSGYLALSQNALPFVVPVTCVLDGDALVVRAGLGLLGKVPLHLGVVAFETGGASVDGRSRWEVLVQGHCEPTDEGLVSKSPPQLSLIDPGVTTVLRMRMELITGWQYGIAPPSLAHLAAKGHS
ncbi:MAG TPA: pyridoxamine 5'-phosphate oxidase family protein [Acidimicrobiales bacterium]|nr:pyridoxamine 5'-phosphate oxidase family protein [Acidimicrobiales bacterium]